MDLFVIIVLIVDSDDDEGQEFGDEQLCHATRGCSNREASQLGDPNVERKLRLVGLYEAEHGHPFGCAIWMKKE